MLEGLSHFSIVKNNLCYNLLDQTCLNQQESTKSVSEGFVSPIVLENSCPSDQDTFAAGPSRPKSPRIENGFLESLRASLKEKITSKIRTLLVESQREMLKLLKPETKENIRENNGEETGNETRSSYNPTKTVRRNSTQSDDPNASRKMVTGDFTNSTNQPKRPKIRTQSQPTSKERPVVARTLIAPDKNDNTTLLMPKASTASLPTFDGKSEKLSILKTFSVTTSRFIQISRKFKR